MGSILLILSLVLQPFPDDLDDLEDPCWMQEIIVVYEDSAARQINQEFAKMEQALENMEMLLQEQVQVQE